MRTIVAVAVLLGSVSVGQDDPKVEEAVDGRYEIESGISIEALGGCRIAPPDVVACWDRQGRPSATLTERVRRELLDYSSDLSFRFGREYRYLVVGRPPKLGSPSYEVPGRSGLNAIHLQRSSEATALDLIRLPWEPETAKVHLLATIHGVDKPLAAEVPFEPGAKVRIGKVEYTIGGFSPVKPSAAGNPPWSYSPFPQGNEFKRWQVVLGVEGSEGARPFGGTTLFDKGGNPIRFVDRNGEPVPATKVLQEDPTAGNYEFGPRAQPRKYFPAMMVPSHQQISGAMSLQSNVNPVRIGRLRLTHAVSRRVRFPDLPLDGASPTSL